VSDNPAYEAILTRRVTRSMSDAPVAPADLEAILRAGRHAPSAGNRRLQPVHPVTDPRMIHRIRLVAPGMLVKPTAALVIAIDLVRAQDYGFAPDTPGLYIDVGTTAATLLLAAHTLGVASCPITSFSRAAVDRLLGLPDGVHSRMIIALGHAATTGEPPAMGRWAR
jgi:nitroreductase